MINPAPHFNQSSYAVRFFRYRCEYSKTHTLQKGYPGVTNTSIGITSNVKLGDMVTDDTWTINGLPVIMLKHVMKKMDGLEFLHRGGTFDVIVHRKGDLLYKPVSRKDYLTYCLTYWTKLWDETIKGTEQMPAQTADEQKIRDDRLNKDKKLKAACLKKFTDELEKTTKEGLLDSTAMVRVMYHPDLIFETKPDQGWILVTENPDYIRKDLPKHVPQFFIVSWRCEEWAPTTKICELFKKDFPFDKLQAMIDK